MTPISLEYINSEFRAKFRGKEDVVQDALIIVKRKIARILKKEDPLAYAWGILRKVESQHRASELRYLPLLMDVHQRLHHTEAIEPDVAFAELAKVIEAHEIELLFEYYRCGLRSRDHRIKLAADLGLPLPTLRQRIRRLRLKVRRGLSPKRKSEGTL
jgi:DNA-directed RNA polymerase specialized sigma24 family protein